MKPKRVGLLGFDQVTALHLVGIADAFAAAVLDNGYGGRIQCYDTYLVGVNSDRFRSECGLSFDAECTLSRTPAFDTVIVAGGTGIRRDGVAQRISNWLLHRVDWRRVGSVCSGIYGIAPTGLLDGREATVHGRFAADLSKRFPRIRLCPNRSIVRDGPCYTSCGLMAGLNLAVAMIREDYGPTVAAAVTRGLTPEGSAETARVPLSDSSFDAWPIDRFAELVGWILRNLQTDLSLDVLARRACMSPNRFGKVFKSIFGKAPGEFVADLRLNEARRRLAQRHKAIRVVAASVGFSDPIAFQRAFKRRFGVPPVSGVESGPEPNQFAILPNE